MKKITVRVSETQHKAITEKARKAGLPVNQYMINLSERANENQQILSAALEHFNRVFDSLFVAINDIKQTNNKPQNTQNHALSFGEFREFNRRYLEVLAVQYGKQDLDVLQAKVNALQKDLTDGKCYKRG